MRRYLINIGLLLLTVISLAACTDEELCEQEHPHTGVLQFNFNNTSHNHCYVVIDRIVNHTSYAMDIDLSTNKTTGLGKYIYNTPSGITNADLTQYKVVPGDYFVIAYDYATTESEPIVPARHANAQDSLCIYLNKHGRLEGSYRASLPEGVSMDRWTDYNDYAPYVATLQRPVYSGDVEMVNVEKDKTRECPLSMSKKSLTLNVKFNIQKKLDEENFKIDKVVLEMAGVTGRMNLRNELQDIDKTYKSMMLATINNGSADAMTKTSVSCSATAEIFSLTPPSSTQVNVGPGIMQVIVYITTESGQSKILQGKINLYNTIKNAGFLTLYVEDPRHAYNKKKETTLNIPQKLTITNEKVVSTPQGGESDGWEHTTESSFTVDDGDVITVQK